MSVALPSSINYSEKLPTLPDAAQSITVAASPINGSNFSQGQIITFDFLNRGFLVPDSIYLSYNYASTNAAVTPQLIGCPFYTALNRLEIQIGSVTVESISNYNVLMHFLTNTMLSVSEKYGLQSAFGYAGNGTTTSIENLDGRLLGIDETGSFSGPLMCCLSNSQKLLPLFAMPQIRMNLTVENLINMFNTTGVAPTTFSLSNVELRYKIVDMGGQIEDVVRSMGDKIYVKSQSFATSTVTTAIGAGYNEIIFNSRFSSVKALFGLNGNTTVNSNRIFDSVDVTRNTGDYQFTIGGVNYPQKVISARISKAQALMELRSAMGSVYDRNNSFSINALEFLAVDNTACFYTSPGKYYLGTSTQKLDSENLLTGVSTNNSPISYKINSGQAVAASPITLVVNYDALFEIDLVNRQVSYKS